MSVASFKGLKESDGEVFKARPAGNYPCRITDVEEKVSKLKEGGGGGNPYWNFKAKVLEGNDEEGAVFYFMNSVPYEGMTDEQHQRAVDGMRHIVDACGMEPTEDVDSSDFISEELALVVTIGTNKQTGKEQNRVSDQLPMSVIED